MRVCLHVAILSAMILLAASFSGPGYPACVAACVASAVAYAECAAAAVGSAASAAATAAAGTAAGAGATVGASAATAASAGAGTAATAGLAGAGAMAGAAAGAAGAAYAAVPAVAIATTAVAGTTLAACAAGCLCFDRTVSVTTRDGPLSITDIRVGDEVLTLDDNGHGTYTSVLNTFEIRKDVPFEFIKIQTGHAAISVTKTHPIVVKQSGENMVKEAGAVKLGDSMVLQGGATTPVTSLSTFTASRKYLIHTRAGTVLAGDMLVKTLGADELPERMQAGRLQIGDVQAFINSYDGNSGDILFEDFMAPVLSKHVFEAAHWDKDGKLNATGTPQFLERESVEV